MLIEAKNGLIRSEGIKKAVNTLRDVAKKGLHKKLLPTMKGVICFLDPLGVRNRRQGGGELQGKDAATPRRIWEWPWSQMGLQQQREVPSGDPGRGRRGAPCCRSSVLRSLLSADII